jgi:alpha-tubulin suppressor-like RCC1 family protein
MGISCGASHTVIFTDEGEAYSWGDGFYGALGQNKQENQYQPGLVKFP